MTTISNAISYAYDPESAEIRFMRKHVYGRWRLLTDLTGIAIMLLMLWWVVRIFIREGGVLWGTAGPGFENVAPVVFWTGIVLGLAASFLCWLLVERLHSTLTDADKEKSTFGRGPVTMKLDETGIHSETPYVRQAIAWGAVTAVVPNRQGIGLRLDRKNFIPVTDAELPEGMTRAQVLQAIESWRAA